VDETHCACGDSGEVLCGNCGGRDEEGNKEGFELQLDDCCLLLRGVESVASR
jgi:hypothetical protein